MGQAENLRIARELLAKLGSAAGPEEIAALFSVDFQFEIPGDTGALPWIGRKTGRNAAAEFIRDTHRLIEQVRFDVQDILASEDRAVIVGELVTKIKATGKIIESSFAIILAVANGEITRFQMLEDSFAVSRAARS